MRIVEINTVCGSGSTGRIAVNLANYAIQKGEDAMVAYGREISNYHNSFKFGTKIEQSVHGVITRLFDMQGMGSYISTKKLVNFLDNYKPDIVHLHLLHGYYLNFELLFSYLSNSGVNVIWTMHDCWAFTGHCTYFDSINCKQWKRVCTNCKLAKEYPSCIGLSSPKRNFQKKKKAFNSINKDKMTIVTPSVWLKELIQESFLSDYKCVVINNGIDLSVFKPTIGDYREKHNLINKKILLGVANGFGSRKGFDDFIQLSTLISDNTVILLVGLESDRIKDLPRNVIGMKRTDSIKQLAELYTTADLFLNLTYEDNFPTVNLEALACGLPVISYRTGGSPESLDETCAKVVDQGDIKAVYQAVEQFFCNPIDKNACIQKAKQYDLEVAYGAYYSLMGKIINEE